MLGLLSSASHEPSEDAGNVRDTAPATSGRRRSSQTSPLGSPAFEVWWARYPRRVGKLAASKAYQKALMLADDAALLAGVEAYRQQIAGMELKFVCHPATWLNQGRWMDETTTTQTAGSGEHWTARCPHTPTCGNATTCQNLQDIAAYKAGRR